jgi:hypothetical protein
MGRGSINRRKLRINKGISLSPQKRDLSVE